ncbi:MAG TPA: hypothetical protein VL651_01870 [Bacteroidia bacterium]|jgi:hypothetical protein|nr:hypothetical protein [Bacteroidia bacterium]
MRKFLPILLLLPLASCSHKDMMSGRADDIEESFIYSGTEGKFIINKEQVFQVTSTETNGKTKTVNGYAEYRISSYDLATGNMTGRAEMGEGIEKACIILGYSPGKIWIYSLDPDLGFHCRDPKTMKVLQNESALVASGVLKGFAFAKPDWTKLREYYGWNIADSSFIITNMTGFHYYFNPLKNTLTQTEDEIPNYLLNTEYLQQEAYFNKQQHLTLKGDVRKKIIWNQTDSIASLDYLDPQLVIDNDPVREWKRKLHIIDSLAHRQEVIEDTLNSIYTRFPVLRNDVMMFNAKTLDEIMMKSEVRDLQRETDDDRRMIDKLEAQWSGLYDFPALSDTAGNFFIVYASDVTDTSGMIISKMNFSRDSFSVAWTQRLPGFYRHPQKASTKGVFDNELADGNPQFHYHWIDIMDDKFIMISQLEMICLDLRSGKVVWQKPL